MPRLYTVSFAAQSIANASGDYDLFEFDAATDKPIELLSVELGQTTELGDAAEENLRLSVVRGHTTGGNGTATTPRPLNPNDAACGAACETVGSTIASAGTGVVLWANTWNVRAPGPIFPPLPQGSGFWTSGADLLVVRLDAAAADDLTLSGTALICEYP